MKKVLSGISLIALLLCSMVLPTSAQDLDNSDNKVVSIVQKADGEIRYYADGSSLEIIVSEQPMLARASSKQGSKACVRKDNSGNVDWEYKLTGQFTYDGTSATCTSAWVDFESESNFKLTYSNPQRASNYAISNSFEVTKYLGILPVGKEKNSIQVSCSQYGTIY